jgi:hypothetical protein
MYTTLHPRPTDPLPVPTSPRLLFGEMSSVHCLTHKVHTDIRGEDVATITMRAASGAHVVVEMAYAGVAQWMAMESQSCSSLRARRHDAGDD